MTRKSHNAVPRLLPTRRSPEGANRPRCCASIILAGVVALVGCGAERTARLEAYLSEIEARGEWSGIVLVAERGQVLLARAASVDSHAGARYTPEVAFPLASISKMLTATAVLQLVESGAVRLDRPVAEVLAGFPYRQITLRHLLSHTSGLPPYNAFFATMLAAHSDTSFTNADFLAGVEAHPVPLRYAPGTNGNYDNVNYIVLALVIERVSGVSYPAYIARRILQPAGMMETRLVQLADLLADTMSAVAMPRLYPHIYSNTTVPAASIPFIVSYWNAYRFSGFGDYVSTSRDLLRFEHSLAAGQLLNRALLDSAYAPVRLANGSPNPGGFGLGWQVSKDTSLGLVISNTGAAVGLSTVFIRNPSRNQVVVVFDNGHYTAQEIGFALLRLLNGDSVAPPRGNLAARLGRALVAQGAERAIEEFHRLRQDTASWRVTEDGINLLGYDFMGAPGAYELPVTHRYADALVVFKLNTELYPTSWNVWDSYAEALAALGRRDEAIVMYQRALTLNPGSENSRAMLRRLQSAPPN